MYFYLLPVMAYFYVVVIIHCIGLVISVSNEWQEMGDKIIDKL